MDRSDVVDTSPFPEILIRVDTRAARAAGEVSSEMAEAVGRLMLGHPVQRSTLSRLGLGAMELRRADDIDVSDPAVRKRYGISEPRMLPSNVVPLKP
jgi:hypothetical protein